MNLIMNLNMNLNKLPYPLIDDIKDYIWGNNIFYKKKFNLVLNKINNLLLPVIFLNSINNQKRDNIIFGDLERFFYCPVCGEKKLCPYTSFFCCEDCEEEERQI